ncbi:MAG: hypothetical protein BWY11_02078 [Firmicutes bacterium ADurb.Bin182]|nr:MAG: hypothetical protein BWY11_02078 [Firmicutes bacterium ADurb.Bin182]
MRLTVPALIIFADTPSLIEVNAQPVGEASPDRHIALPVSDSGDYYITAAPLYETQLSRRYAITRKLSLEEGQAKAMVTKDFSVCSWPGGIYELNISPGLLPVVQAAPFPYTLDTLSWQTKQGKLLLTLYYEQGLKLLAENNGAITASYALGDGRHGEIMLLEQEDAQFAMIHTGMENIERMILLDDTLNTALDISGNCVRFMNGRIELITKLDTSRRHETRSCFDYIDGDFLESEPEIGFFTHDYEPPATFEELSAAFLEAVREGFTKEALGYLTPELAENLSLSDLKEFFGDFSGCRAPVFSDEGHLMGLIYDGSDGVSIAKLFRFEFEGMRISNIGEA